MIPKKYIVCIVLVAIAIMSVPLVALSYQPKTCADHLCDGEGSCVVRPTACSELFYSNCGRFGGTLELNREWHSMSSDRTRLEDICKWYIKGLVAE